MTIYFNLNIERDSLMISLTNISSLNLKQIINVNIFMKKQIINYKYLTDTKL